MRTFAIPAPIGGVTFRQYVQLLLDTDPRALLSPGLRNAVRVEGEILRAEDSSTAVVLTPRDWLALRALVQTPDSGSFTRSDGDSAEKIAARALRLSTLDAPFVTAVVNATLV